MGCCWLPGPRTNKSQAHPSTSNTQKTSLYSSLQTESPFDSPVLDSAEQKNRLLPLLDCHLVRASSYLLRHSPATSPLQELDACRFGTKDPSLNRKIANFPGPP